MTVQISALVPVGRLPQHITDSWNLTSSPTHLEIRLQSNLERDNSFLASYYHLTLSLLLPLTAQQTTGEVRKEM